MKKTCQRCGEQFETRLSFQKYCGSNGKGTGCAGVMRQAWRMRHPEAIKRYVAKWRKNNRAKHNEDGRRWHAENRARSRKNRRAWYEANKGKAFASEYLRRKRIKENGGFFSAEEWETMKVEYGFTCPWCGMSEPEIRLVPDHIVPIKNGGPNDAWNRQPLCIACNLHKGMKTLRFFNRQRA